MPRITRTKEYVTQKWVAKATPQGDCLISQATPAGKRPRVSYGGTTSALLYTLVWEVTHGPIPSGLVLHHRCLQPRCIRVEHLQLVTPEEHNTIHGSLLTACKKAGHPYTPENTRMTRTGRACRACEKERDRNRSSRRQAA